MPKIGCLGIVLVAIVVMVVGGLFCGVSKPGVHLAPGNLLTADEPHHWTKTDKAWADEYGVVDMEIEVEGTEDKVLTTDEAFTLVAKPDEAENMPSERHYEYEWKLIADDFEYTATTEEADLRVNDPSVNNAQYPADAKNLRVEVLVTDVESGLPVVGAALTEHEKPTFPINNTMISAWLTLIVLLVVIGIGMRKRALIPRGLQNAIEWVVEWLLTFVENAAGRENGRRFFPIVATIFFFVITNAYLALFPFFNVIGWGHTMTYETPFFGDQEGFVVTTQLFRSANTDVNLPLALAIISFFAVEYWGIRSVGIGAYIGKFIKIKPVFKSIFSRKPMNMVTAFVEAFVGFIELLTEIMRLVSFTFRLFGNMTAGEVLLMMMGFLLPFLVAVPFYGLELLVGFIQALVFAGLTLGFAMIAVMPHEHEEEGH